MTRDAGSTGNELDSRRIERRMLLYYTQDGLWDLCLGACVLAWGLAILTDMAAFVGVFCAVAVSLVQVFKQRVTYPRAGYARLRSGGALKKSVSIILAGMVAIGLVVFLTTMSGPAAFVREYSAVLFGTLIAAVLSLAAWWSGASRFYAYAAAIWVVGAARQWGNAPLPAAVIVAGTLILTAGTLVLLRFLREYPVREEDAVGR